MLGADPDLAETWNAIVADIVPEMANLDLRQPPELYCFDGGMIAVNPDTKPTFLDPPSESYRWYPGKLAFQIIQALSTGRFLPERDFQPTADLLERWTHDNGLLWAMSVGNYGHVGAWTESLGIVGAIQEMLLQSWDGGIRLFPGLPVSQDASFHSLRTEGAFLVSANRRAGAVEFVEILSEAGLPCRLENPWLGRSPSLQVEQAPPTEASPTEDGKLVFQTVAGGKYRFLEGG